MQKHLARSFAAVAVFVLAACGGDEGPSFAGEVSEGTAVALGYEASNIAQDIMDNMEDFDDEGVFPDLAPGMSSVTYQQKVLASIREQAFRRNPRLAGSLRDLPALASAVCIPSETGVDSLGNAIDSDEDGVPDDYQVSYPANCTEVSGDYTFKYSGSYRIRDLAGVFGYRLDLGSFAFRYTNDSTGEYDEIKVGGFDQGVFTADGIAQSSDLTYTVSFAYDDTPPAPSPASASMALVNGSFSWIYEVTSTYDPETTITYGAELPSGDLTLDASFRWLYGNSGNGVGNFRFDLSTPSPLHYDTAACNDIDSGVLRGELNGDESVGFEVTWSACQDYAVTVFGTTGGVSAPQP